MVLVPSSFVHLPSKDRLCEARSSAVIVSTLAEAWGVVNSGLVKDGIVDDILCGLPVDKERLQELGDVHAAMQRDIPQGCQAQLRLIVDNVDQVDFLEEDPRAWSVYVKVDCGTSRAGLPSGSQTLKDLLARIVKSSGVELHGIYAHAGHSYDSRSNMEAASCLTAEIDAVHSAALHVKSLDSSLKLVLSVGSTPTAHAALDSEEIRRAIQSLSAKLELHAGRGKDGLDEVLCNAGGIAMSKDDGPFGGKGHVLFPQRLRGWELQRISQEHGVLALRPGGPEDWERQWRGSSSIVVPATPIIGDRVRVVPQHACMTASAHSWYFVIDPECDGKEGLGEGQEVVRDVWVPWKGW